MRCRRCSYLVTALVLAVALVACGSDDSDDPPPTTPGPRPSWPPTGTRRRRRSSSSTTSRTGGRRSRTRRIPTIQTPPTWRRRWPRAWVSTSRSSTTAWSTSTRTRSSSTQAEVDSDVSMAPTLAEADRRCEVLTRPEARGCFEAGFEKAFTYGIEHPAEGDEVSEGLELGEITFHDLELRRRRPGQPCLPRLGAHQRPRARATPLLRPRVHPGGTGPRLDLLPRLRAPFDQGLATDLARAMASRMPTA